MCIRLTGYLRGGEAEPLTEAQPVFSTLLEMVLRFHGEGPGFESSDANSNPESTPYSLCSLSLPFWPSLSLSVKWEKYRLTCGAGRGQNEWMYERPHGWPLAIGRCSTNVAFCASFPLPKLSKQTIFKPKGCAHHPCVFWQKCAFPSIPGELLVTPQHPPSNVTAPVKAFLTV